MKNWITGILLVSFGLILIPLSFSVADTVLEIRDRCNEGVTCLNAQEQENQLISVLNHNQGEEFSVDLFIKNPAKQKIISVQSWLKYNPNQLEGVKIDTSNSVFELVAPGENNFDAKKGIIRIGRSAIGTDTKVPELFVANLTFKVKTSQQTKTKLAFYDYQIGELGHTSVRVMEDNFPVNVLAGKPKEFLISLNGVAENLAQNIWVWEQNINQPQSPLNLSRPTGLKATTGNDYIFLVWDEMKDLNLKGFNLYYSTTSGRYLQRRPVGNVNQYELNHLRKGETYYLAITAYDQLNRETDYSDEVKITVGEPNSSTAPILITREEVLMQIPRQPQNGPADVVILFLIASAVSGAYIIYRRKFII